MKFAWVVIALALSLAGLGIACGPEEKYCFDEHKSCSQAMQDKITKQQEIEEARERARREAEAGEIGDGGATVIGQ